LTSLLFAHTAATDRRRKPADLPLRTPNLQVVRLPAPPGGGAIQVRVAFAEALAAVAAGQPEDPAPAGPGTGTVVRALARLLGDPGALVRAAAHEALGTTGCPPSPAGRSPAALASATTDPDADVRAYAARAL
jgi:hypothetical protein